MSLSCVLSSFNLQNLSIYFLNIERNEAPAECRSGFQTFILVLEMSSNLERYFEEWKIWGVVNKWCSVMYHMEQRHSKQGFLSLPENKAHKC